MFIEDPEANEYEYAIVIIYLLAGVPPSAICSLRLVWHVLRFLTLRIPRPRKPAEAEHVNLFVITFCMAVFSVRVFDWSCPDYPPRRRQEHAPGTFCCGQTPCCC